MILAIASGKGGTGKTTVATSLALALAREGLDEGKIVFADCDVEEPNAALFLNPRLIEKKDVHLMVPEVDSDLCTFCGRCAEVCQYHAIAVVGQKVLVFPELCHGCGSCALVCSAEAISEVPRTMGIVERGRVGSMTFVQGTMNIGEAMASPIIREVKRWAIGGGQDGLVILDAPPGTACPVVESLRGSDYALMVTEPTPFGLHDLRLAVQVARGELGIPVGVVINREGIGDKGVEEYCRAEGLPILMRIPFDRRIAVAYSDGLPVVSAMPEYWQRFLALYERIAQQASASSREEVAIPPQEREPAG